MKGKTKYKQSNLNCYTNIYVYIYIYIHASVLWQLFRTGWVEEYEFGDPVTYLSQNIFQDKSQYDMLCFATQKVMVCAKMLAFFSCFPTDQSVLSLETVPKVWKRPKWSLWCIYYVQEKKTMTKELLSGLQYKQAGSKSRLFMLQVTLKPAVCICSNVQHPHHLRSLKVWFSRQEIFSILIWNGILIENQ